MFKVALFVVVAQALFVQNAFAQCGNSWGVMGNNLLGVGNLGGGCSGPNVQSNPGQNVGGWGTGEIGIAGDLPVCGTTSLQGSLPVLGAVQFNGNLPAAGVVSIVGSSPGCGCGCGY